MVQEKLDGAAPVIHLEARSLAPAADDVVHEQVVEERQDIRINDEQCISDLQRLKDLRSFFIQEAVNVDRADASSLAFGRLNLLRFNHSGRAPTEEEWKRVEYHTQTLFGLLTDPLRRRFILGDIP